MAAVTSTSFGLLPEHIRLALLKDPMFLQRKHDAAVARHRLITGADTWDGHQTATAIRAAAIRDGRE